MSFGRWKPGQDFYFTQEKYIEKLAKEMLSFMTSLGIPPKDNTGWPLQLALIIGKSSPIYWSVINFPKIK